MYAENVPLFNYFSWVYFSVNFNGILYSMVCEAYVTHYGEINVLFSSNSDLYNNKWHTNYDRKIIICWSYSISHEVGYVVYHQPTASIKSVWFFFAL